MPDRRTFLGTAVAGALGAGLTGVRAQELRGAVPPIPSPGSGSAGPGAQQALDLLFLGGTGFLGPHQVEYALSRGHNVTLFNRGRTNPELFPEVEKLVGDRAAPDYSALEGRRWDAVIDNSANIATWVQGSAQALRDATDRYLYVSSLSAHSDNSIVDATEEAPVFTREEYEATVAQGIDPRRAFGQNKAEAERIVLETFGTRGLVIRPGLIVGPGDRSDRFTYWPVRMDRGGDVVAPGDGTDMTQIVDVRDLARFMVDQVEASASGIYNAVGRPMPMAELVYGVRAITASVTRVHWVPVEILREFEVGGWIDMPTWVYPSPETAGFSTWDASKAIEAGLSFKPLADTARDTLEWWKAGPGQERELRTGLAPEKESRIVEAFLSRTG